MLLHKRALRRECLLLLAILTWSAAFCQVLPGSSDAAQSVSSPDVQRLLTMAEAGDVRSQVKLARAYQSGAGTDPDEIKAFAWLGKAAATGDAQAENELGVAYRAGSGVGRSKEEAVTWYRKSAKQGYAPALYNLGVAFYNGDGVQPSYKNAFAWFMLASDAGSSKAAEAIQQVTGELRPADLQAAKLQIGEFYESGAEIPQDYLRALRWFRVLADEGYPTAQLKLAVMYARGLGVAQDDVEAAKWSQRAAIQKFAPALFFLGTLFESGKGVPQDLVTALECYVKAAGTTYPAAFTYLGTLYETGKIVRQNDADAYLYFFMANQQSEPGGAEGMQRLEGKLSPKQIQSTRKRAIKWWRERPKWSRKWAAKQIART